MSRWHWPSFVAGCVVGSFLDFVAFYLIFVLPFTGG